MHMRYKLYSGWPRNRNINNMHRYVFHLNQQDIFVIYDLYYYRPMRQQWKLSSTFLLFTCTKQYYGYMHMRYKLYSGWPRNRNKYNMHRYVFHLNQEDIFLFVICINIDPCSNNGNCPNNSVCSHAPNSTVVNCTCKANFTQTGSGLNVTCLRTCVRKFPFTARKFVFFARFVRNEI